MGLILLVAATVIGQRPLPAQEKWTSRSPVMSAFQGRSFGAIAFGGGMYVGIGSPYSALLSPGLLATSPDGVSWTTRNIDTAATLLDVCYGAGRFVAVGTEGVILASDDGTVWSAQSTSNGSRVRFVSVTYGAGLFVAVCLTDNAPAPVRGRSIYTSSDGKAWTPRVAMAQEFMKVAYNGARFAAISGGGDTYISSDGITWILGGSSVIAFADTVLKFTAANGLFVGVGMYGYIISSPDGVTWTKREISASANFQLQGVVGTPFGFIAVGFEATGYDREAPTVGTNSVVLTSADGVAWSRRMVGLATPLVGVVFGDGQAVVVGINGAVLTTDDLSTFRVRAAPVVIYSAASGPTGFAATGTDGFILSSADGLNWNAQTDGTGSVLRGLTYGAGLFVGVGTSSRLLYQRPLTNRLSKEGGSG